MTAYLEIPEQMIKKEIHTLLVDDHPVVLEAYKSILTASEHGIGDANIYCARTCEEAVQKIDRSAQTNHFDLLFFDIQLPASSDGRFLSGIDVALYAKRMLPKAKIAMLTMQNENNQIRKILEKVSPDALLIKDEIDKNELLTALNTILYNPPYYSATVLRYLTKEISYPIEILDHINRRILIYISKDISVERMGDYINLSAQDIAQRKSNIRQILELGDSASDQDMVAESRRRGYL